MALQYATKADENEVDAPAEQRSRTLGAESPPSSWTRAPRGHNRLSPLLRAREVVAERGAPSRLVTA
jgi:hypothetical protein